MRSPFLCATLPATRHRLPFLLAGVTLLFALGTANAGRPLTTDDAGVLDRGACEAEAVLEELRLPGERARGRSLAGGCGIAPGFQLALGVARVSLAGDRETGIDIAGKWALWSGAGEAAEAPSLALGWAFGAARATGGNWRHVATELKLLFTAPLSADWTLHANLGHARDETPEGLRSTTWGLALEHAGWPAGGLHWAPMAEVYGDDRERPWTAVGLRLSLQPERWWADIALGRQMQPGGARSISLGLKRAF